MRYTDTENNSNKTFQAFVSKMFSTVGEGAKWLPINAADPDAADREMARRRKEEADARDASASNSSFHHLPTSMKAKMIKAGSPELSDKKAIAKASIVPGSRRKRGISEEDEKRESTKSMIARLVAKRMKKLGQPVPDDIVKDMEPNIHAADPRPTNEANESDTTKMLRDISYQHGMAQHHAGIARNNARRDRDDPKKVALHKARVAHFEGHMKNYAKIHDQAKAAHDAGNHEKALKIGSAAAKGLHAEQFR